MSTQNQLHYNLESGPSLKDLMLALFDEYAGEPRVVTFEIKGEPVEGDTRHQLIAINGVTTYRSVVVQIIGCKRESSFDNWLFQGYSTLWGEPVNGYFNTRTRKGWINYGAVDVNVEEITFGGNVIFGLDRAVTINGQIIALKGAKEELVMGAVSIHGDSRGYVPSGLKSGLGYIVGFCLPSVDGETDHIVHVRDAHGRIGWVKPSNLIQ